MFVDLCKMQIFMDHFLFVCFQLPKLFGMKMRSPFRRLSSSFVALQIPFRTSEIKIMDRHQFS